MLGRVVMRKRWRCLAYCLMDNHVHLLVETVDANLGRGMQRLHSSYAQTFNARHGRSGHVFQGRYGAARMTDDAQLYVAAAYIARTPWPPACASCPSSGAGAASQQSWAGLRLDGSTSPACCRTSTRWAESRDSATSSSSQPELHEWARLVLNRRSLARRDVNPFPSPGARR